MCEDTIIVFRNYSIKIANGRDEINELCKDKVTRFVGSEKEAKNYIIDAINKDKINRLAKVLFRRLAL